MRYLRPLLVACAVLAAAGFTTLTPVHAGTDCDTSEQVACITLPTTPSTPSAPAAGAANASSAAAAPIFCAPPNCCGPVQPGGPLPPAGPNVPLPNPCPPVPNPCPPYVSNATGSSSGNAAAVSVPVPPPGNCTPYRTIYSTINLGNAADVRALRTVSTSGLSQYWRQGALAQLQSQVQYLQSIGDYASPQLYSIQVQSATLDLLSNTARIQTLEHWLYQEWSSFDGSLVTSQDEWVTNNYVLTQNGSTWYITSDTISPSSTPPIVPAGAQTP